jgi:hypothetical protein
VPHAASSSAGLSCDRHPVTSQRLASYVAAQNSVYHLNCYDPYQLNRPGVTVHNNISRLVEFLLFMGESDVAKKVSLAAVKATLELVPLRLQVPTWIREGS